MEMIQKMQRAIDLDDKSYWIADSALYTEENIKLLGTETKWITHIPATVAEAQRHCSQVAWPHFRSRCSFRQSQGAGIYWLISVFLKDLVVAILLL